MATSTSPTDSLSRAEKTARTRASIVRSAHDLFAGRGYRAVSLRDIAAHAGLSHPGLLRHFATKDAILVAVVDAVETSGLDVIPFPPPGSLPFSGLAEHNATVPGYLPLFAALTGEASVPDHPAHAYMRARYVQVREAAARTLADARTHGRVDPSRDPAGEAVRIAAAWDGLQLLAQYLPQQVDIVDALRRHEERLGRPVGHRDHATPSRAEDPSPIAPAPPLVPADDTSGYRVGRSRRTAILTDALALFARSGYGDTSLRQVADAVGVSKSTLMHHYPTKEALLSAVVAERDRRIERKVEQAAIPRAADALRAMPDGAARDAVDEPGLIQVYAVLSCEAAPADHPAHASFTHRFRATVAHFTALFDAARRDGDLSYDRDPAFEAMWWVALWDGLQYQWLYDREGIDVAAHLRAHLDDVLPAPPLAQPEAATTSSTASP